MFTVLLTYGCSFLRQYAKHHSGKPCMADPVISGALFRYPVISEIYRCALQCWL